jgi:hypothetical protein
MFGGNLLFSFKKKSNPEPIQEKKLHFLALTPPLDLPSSVRSQNFHRQGKPKASSAGPNTDSPRQQKACKV